MGRTSRGDNKSKQQRQQTILRLIQENPISRQEIATMLLRTVKAAVPQLNTDTASAPAFVDSGDIADWAREGVNYFASKEIIKGANGAFMPKANTTCEAAIALVKRTFDSFTAI